MSTVDDKRINLYNIRYKNSMKPIDWAYYTKFYPETAKAIHALRLDTGLGLKEAKKVVEEIFARLERGEVEQRKANAEYVGSKKYHGSDYNTGEYRGMDPDTKEDLKKAGKVTGCCLLAIPYIFLGVIFKLAGMYTGKKRR